MLTSALSELRVREAADIVNRVIGGRRHELVGHLMVFRGDGARERMAKQLAGWPDGATAVVAESPDPAAQGAQVAEAVDRLVGIGLTRVLVHSTDEEADPVGFVDWVGTAVAPRVRR
jgi:hypothetical protein